MSSGLTIGVGGALGRMGRAVSGLARARGDIALAGRYDRPDAVDPGDDPLPLTTAAEVMKAADVIIDFTTGPATAALATAAAKRGAPALVLGATGLTGEETAAISQAARHVAIVKSANFSVGVNVRAGLVEQAARRLGPDIWDIEILESHHRRKVDAPSGAAYLLGEAAARGRGRPLTDLVLPPRHGITGERPREGIGFSSLRGGGIVGEHSVVFAAEEETLTLTHIARDRALFARGALEAAIWVARRPAGLYDMMDVLGFRD